MLSRAMERVGPVGVVLLICALAFGAFGFAVAQSRRVREERVAEHLRRLAGCAYYVEQVRAGPEGHRRVWRVFYASEVEHRGVRLRMRDSESGSWVDWPAADCVIEERPR